MKHFIIEVTYTVPMDMIEQTVDEHRAFLQTGFDKGWLLASGPMVPRIGGMIIARAPSLEAIQGFFANDPYILKGMADYRYIEFQPVKRQPFLEEWVSG